jgi:hypothetical protein
MVLVKDLEPANTRPQSGLILKILSNSKLVKITPIILKFRKFWFRQKFWCRQNFWFNQNPHRQTPFAPIPALLIAFLLAISKNAVFWFHLLHQQVKTTISPHQYSA